MSVRVTRALLALALLLTLPALASAQHRVVRGAQLDADGQFRIWNLAGSVRVIGWDADSVHVEAELDDVAREVFLFGAQGQGGKLTTDDNGRSGIAHLVVRVPRRATVWVKTMSASVTVNGVAGAIDVYAVTGNVVIASPAAETVYAESMGGRVHVTGRARVVRLRSGSGRIDFVGTTPDLTITTVSGDVLARATALVRGVIESVGGTVHLGASFGRDASLEVLTHDGDLDLTVPARTPVDWLVSTVSGQVDVLSPLRRAARERGARTTVRDDDDRDIPASSPGGARVELRTFSGNLTLRGAT